MGPPLGPGGEDITWPDQVAPRGRKASSTRKIKPQTSNLGVPWFPGTHLWLGGTPSPIGRVSGSGLSRAWVVFEPPPPPATEGVGPGIGI